jgi:hypothetical protein
MMNSCALGGASVYKNTVKKTEGDEMAAASVEIELSEQAAKLFADYERYTNVTAEVYIKELVAKTLPTLRAMVSAFEECQDNPDAVMEVFGRKMGEMMLEQKQAQQAASQSQ